MALAYHGEDDSTAGYELVEARLGNTTEALQCAAARHGAVGVEHAYGLLGG